MRSNNKVRKDDKKHHAHMGKKNKELTNSNLRFNHNAPAMHPAVI